MAAAETWGDSYCTSRQCAYQARERLAGLGRCPHGDNPQVGCLPFPSLDSPAHPPIQDALCALRVKGGRVRFPTILPYNLPLKLPTQVDGLLRQFGRQLLRHSADASRWQAVGA